MDNDLAQRIIDLDDVHALEAGRFYALEAGAPLDGALDEVVASDEIMSAPHAHSSELAELSRLLLLEGAAGGDEEAVRRSVEGAGETQFVLGGAEIVMLAGLLVTAYQIKVVGGKTSETTTTTTTTHADGSQEVLVSREVKFGISGSLVSLLSKLWPGGG